MTWRVHPDGHMEKITTHNWWIRDNELVCATSWYQRPGATCVGCGVVVTSSELIEVFGTNRQGFQGLIAAEMADGIAAGIFADN